MLLFDKACLNIYLNAKDLDSQRLEMKVQVAFREKWMGKVTHIVKVSLKD